MKLFWRNKPLTEKENMLFSLVLEAHNESTKRNNASSCSALNGFMGSGSYINGIISALSTLGGLHAPLEQTYDFLLNPTIEKDKIIPGWGSSFYKGEPDSVWKEVDQCILENWHIGEVIKDTTTALHKLGKQIYPNPSCYTAATAIVLDIPKKFIGWLFIEGRLFGWTKIMETRRIQWDMHY